MGLRVNVKKRVNIGKVAAGLNARKVIEKSVYDEMVAMLDRCVFLHIDAISTEPVCVP